MAQIKWHWEDGWVCIRQPVRPGNLQMDRPIRGSHCLHRTGKPLLLLAKWNPPATRGAFTVGAANHNRDYTTLNGLPSPARHVQDRGHSPTCSSGCVHLRHHVRGQEGKKTGKSQCKDWKWINVQKKETRRCCRKRQRLWRLFCVKINLFNNNAAVVVVAG